MLQIDQVREKGLPEATKNREPLSLLVLERERERNLMEEKVWVVLYLEGKRGSTLWTTKTIYKTVLRQILTEPHAAFFTIRGISVTQSLTLKLESLLLRLRYSLLILFLYSTCASDGFKLRFYWVPSLMNFS